MGVVVGEIVVGLAVSPRSIRTPGVVVVGVVGLFPSTTWALGL